MIYYYYIVLLAAIAFGEHIKCADKPNILFIMADDLGWNDVGYHGSEISTPNIDKLAADGVRMERYYVGPNCGPSRAQFLSGRYRASMGIQHSNFFPCRPFGLPARYPTIADKLKEAGYTNHMIGKWHLGYHSADYIPTNRGFDTFRGMLLGSGDHYTHVNSRALDFHDNETPYNGSFNEYSTYAFTKRAKELIAEQALNEKPMFMWLSYQSPHSPLQVPQKYRDMYTHIRNRKRRKYAGMVTALDAAVGEVVDTVKESGLYNNTLIIFSTDNGGQASQGASNYPLRGNKNTYFDAGLRGVGIVSGSLIKNKGSLNSQLTHITDWMPTLLHLANVDSSDFGLDGVNQWDTIQNNVHTTRKEILHNIDPLSISSDRQKYPDVLFDSRIQSAITWGRWKLITGNPGYSGWIPDPRTRSYSRFARRISNTNTLPGTVYLYNLIDDPEERTNEFKIRPKLAKFLMEKLEKYKNSSLPVWYPSRSSRTSCPPRAGEAWGPYLPSEKKASDDLSQKIGSEPFCKNHDIFCRLLSRGFFTSTSLL